ncbi:caldesmon-like [Sitophilus oryzae]|uniref:Caldesmon-like n=1 Tax=Sitophilus oryzae TaxID=7048 RepID=A0A6J2Y9I8_SITOR|nr:caldesmon-like [Sitophilus oryzae]
MPGLPDEMYCSEQICIPPTFPYLLRQYAKAAIRTQPRDLLKWSTAYFRCLSLNIPPPVKPRLEYPIPRDYYGITPGWLKALIFQLQNNLTISFKVLWDRWIGACLQHKTLIKILCLGGFDDVEAIPWLRFVALCAGTLSDDLTHTMILLCEIISEEPEGGSAIISCETFIDLYTFLANIDASHDQILRNYLFRDSLLSLWREKVQKVEDMEEVHEDVLSTTERSSESKSSTLSAEETEKKDDVYKVVSCPSLPDDDHYSLDYLKEEMAEDEEAVDQLDVALDNIAMEQEAEEGTEHVEESTKSDVEESEEKKKQSIKSEDEDDLSNKHEDKIKSEEDIEETDVEKHSVDDQETSKEVEPEHEKHEDVEEKSDEKMDETETEAKEYESVDTISNEPLRDLEHVFDEDITLKEDLERLKALQQEMAGETDDELEKFKCKLIADMPLTQSQEEGVKHFMGSEIMKCSSDKLKVIGEKKSKSDTSTDSQIEEGDKRPYEDVFVEAIPGIGGIVPEDLVKAVVFYVKKCAKNQHGMIMPRNIRHYSCPPLEVLND